YVFHHTHISEDESEDNPANDDLTLSPCQLNLIGVRSYTTLETFGISPVMREERQLKRIPRAQFRMPQRPGNRDPIGSHGANPSGWTIELSNTNWIEPLPHLPESR
ncbi:MAG: hypothetical protein JW986_01345, partial [Methanotrichaceae archaeon]|nr:hypothetical protein [Methanotrichaceae archaeon]